MLLVTADTGFVDWISKGANFQQSARYACSSPTWRNPWFRGAPLIAFVCASPSLYEIAETQPQFIDSIVLEDMRESTAREFLSAVGLRNPRFALCDSLWGEVFKARSPTFYRSNV